MDYAKAQRLLATARNKEQGKPIDRNTRILQRPDHLAVRLHNTNIIELYPDGRVTLNTGGWKTVTTKERINSYSGIRVWSDKGTWLAGNGERTVTFADGITFYPDGRVENEGPADLAGMECKLKREAKSYASRFIDALYDGKVPAPSMSDCWGCCMRTAEGKTPMGGPDHIHSHMADDYFVPSLLVNAMKQFGASIAQEQTAHAYMQGKLEYAYSKRRDDFIAKGLQKNVYRYCLRQLGIAT